MQRVDLPFSPRAAVPCVALLLDDFVTTQVMYRKNLKTWSIDYFSACLYTYFFPVFPRVLFCLAIFSPSSRVVQSNLLITMRRRGRSRRC